MRKLLGAFFGVASVLAVSGCTAVVEESEDSAGHAIIDATGANQAVAYSVAQEMVELSVQTPSVTITGIPAGKAVYLLKTNPSDTEIHEKNTRYVSASTGLEKTESRALVKKSASRAAQESQGDFEDHLCQSVLLADELDALNGTGRAAAGAVVVRGDGTGEGAKAYKIGDSKTLWVDTNYTQKIFEKRTAYLRAAGKTCYVWVVGGSGSEQYWTSGKTDGRKVDSQTAQQIASMFDRMYGMVRNVFGEESDELILNGNTSTFGAMKDYSDTAEKVNIVIYDINNDGLSGTTVGYFYAKDYVTGYNSGTYAYSNSGKYFYLDAHFLVNRRGLALSTLAHEFQHMIDWGRKTMEGYKQGKKLRTSAAQNEMMSMLCEDIMKQFFKDTFNGFQESDTPLQRLSVFCRHYYDIGLEFDDSTRQNLTYSYANNYAFGAWLIRNYGGVELISRMAKNSYVNVECIEKAAGVSMDELLKAYAAACAVEDDDFGFNKAIPRCDSSMVYRDEQGTYEYPIGAIDLWELESALAVNAPVDITDTHSYAGPVCFDADFQQELRPYGIMLAKIGDVSAASDSVTLSFNTTGLNAAQKTYILIK